MGDRSGDQPLHVAGSERLRREPEACREAPKAESIACDGRPTLGAVGRVPGGLHQLEEADVVLRKDERPEPGPERAQDAIRLRELELGHLRRRLPVAEVDVREGVCGDLVLRRPLEHHRDEICAVVARLGVDGLVRIDGIPVTDDPRGGERRRIEMVALPKRGMGDDGHRQWNLEALAEVEQNRKIAPRPPAPLRCLRPRGRSRAAPADRPAELEVDREREVGGAVAGVDPHEVEVALRPAVQGRPGRREPDGAPGRRAQRRARVPPPPRRVTAPSPFGHGAILPNVGDSSFRDARPRENVDAGRCPH
jgi:hypothetical protein